PPAWAGGIYESGMRRPQPKVADFISQSPRAGFIAGRVRFDGKYVFRGHAHAPELEEKQTAERDPALARRPAGAGFTSEKLGAQPSPATARPPAGPRFRPLAAATANFAQPAVPGGQDPKLRPGQFRSGLAREQSMPTRIRESAIAPRWQPLS